MGWVAVPDDVFSRADLASVSPRARWLWLCARAYSGQHLTNGAVPLIVLRLAGATERDARALVDARLWQSTLNGYLDPTYLETNASSAERQRQREYERTRKRARRETMRVSAPCPAGTTYGSPAPGTGDVPTAQDRNSTGQIQSPPGSPPLELAQPTPAPAARRARKVGVEVPLPDSWEPSDQARAFARAHGLDLDLEAVSFRGHASAHDRRCVSWHGAFSSWLAKGAGRASARPIQRDTPTSDLGW